MVKKFEELQIQDDFMFGAVMRSPKLCKLFLERVLNVKIAELSYPRSQEIIDLSAGARGVRLDIYVEDEKGTAYDVEMQTTDEGNLPKRMRYYQGMMDLNILEKGNDYKNLKRSLVILVCTFDLFDHGRHIYTFENRCLQESGLALKDGTVKIILNTKGTAEDVDSEMERLLKFIDGHQPEDDFTRELETAVESIRKNEKWRR